MRAYRLVIPTENLPERALLRELHVLPGNVYTTVAFE